LKKQAISNSENSNLNSKQGKQLLRFENSTVQKRIFLESFRLPLKHGKRQELCIENGEHTYY
jgi:hypothetical protein